MKRRPFICIDVRGTGAVTLQTRAYAEYRLFAALTRSSKFAEARSAHVLLSHVEPNHGRPEFLCTITIVLGASDEIRVRAAGVHAYGAINRAVGYLASPPASSDRRGQAFTQGQSFKSG
jgi:hypothetical protein